MTIIKNGFAKYCRAGGFSGVESRLIETLRNIEECHNIPEGALGAELLALTTGTFDETLSSNISTKPTKNIGLRDCSEI